MSATTSYKETATTTSMSTRTLVKSQHIRSYKPMWNIPSTVLPRIEWPARRRPRVYWPSMKNRDKHKDNVRLYLSNVTMLLSLTYFSVWPLLGLIPIVPHDTWWPSHWTCLSLNSTMWLTSSSQLSTTTCTRGLWRWRVLQSQPPRHEGREGTQDLSEFSSYKGLPHILLI